MKKSLVTLFLCMGLAVSPLIANGAEDAAQKSDLSNPAGNPVDQFTGESWIHTSEGEKQAYLFGIDSAIAVEYFINSKEAANAAKSGKKPVYTLSPFDRGWMQAFKNMTRKAIVKQVDDWYAAHPESLNRPVLSVIWREVVEPRLESGAKK